MKLPLSIEVEMEKVGVIIPTYNRRAIVLECMRALWVHINDAVLIFYVGIDGTDDTIEFLRMYEKKAPCLGVQVIPVENKPRLGLGANLNNLLRMCQEDYIIQLDDDHILTRSIDLAPHIQKLKDDRTAGWIRLMGIGSHNYRATLKGDYWYIDWQCQELYIPSNRPHIKHKRFHEFFGYYPVARKLGETEEGFCHQCKDKAREAIEHSQAVPAPLPHVLVPLNSNSETAWQHVGQSFQLQGE